MMPALFVMLLKEENVFRLSTFSLIVVVFLGMHRVGLFDV